MDDTNYMISVTDYRDARDRHYDLEAKIEDEVDSEIRMAIARVEDRFDIAIAIRKS